MKKIISLVFVFLIAFSAFPLSVFASESSSEDIELVAEDLSKTDIEYDFKYVFAGQYDVSTYKYSLTDSSLHFITAIESEDSHGAKELYIYVHNPSRAELYKNSEHNTISMSVGEQDSFSQYKLEYITSYSSTLDGDEYINGLILKLRVKDVPTFDSLTRIYKLGEFEWLKKGETLPEYYISAMKYEFTTNSLGYVSCIATDQRIVETKAFHTFYRIKIPGELSDTYEDIRAVYFPVKKTYVDSYGGMAYIEATWKEYDVYNVLVTDDLVLKNAFYSKLGTSLEDFNYSVLFNKSYYQRVLGRDVYRSAYNPEALSDWMSWDYTESKDDENFLVTYKFPGDRFLANIFAPKTSTHLGYPISGVFYCADTSTYDALAIYGEDLLEYYEPKVDDLSYTRLKNYEPGKKYYFNIDTEIIEGTAGERCSWWEAFKNGGLYYNTLSEDAKKTFSNFTEIERDILKALTDEQITETYYVDSHDVADFKATVLSEDYEDYYWYMLRYEVTDYETSGALVIDNETGATVGNSYIASMSMIYDFDYIDVAFGDPRDPNTYCVFPVGMSPTSSMTDIWNPSKPLVETPDFSWMNEFYAKIERLLAVIVAIFLVVIVFRIVMSFRRRKVVVKYKNKKE